MGTPTAHSDDTDGVPDVTQSPPRCEIPEKLPNPSGPQLFTVILSASEIED